MLKAEAIAETDERDGSDNAVDVDVSPKLCPRCGTTRLVRRALLPMLRPLTRATGTDPAPPNTS